MRLKLTLAYVGTDYRGWQRQPEGRTVQGELESAVASIGGTPTRVGGAGRTDAGVHAAGQVADFDAGERLGPRRWQAALNAVLPATIRVLEATRVADSFDARRNAIRKTYRYGIDRAPVASPFLAPFAWHRRGRLDVDAMRAAAAGLLGVLDQRAFATQPQGTRRLRPLESVAIEEDRLLTITVVGRSFLRYAVRGMVGTLVEVGAGQRDPASIAAIAASGDRSRAGATAPAHGLCLVRVDT